MIRFIFLTFFLACHIACNWRDISTQSQGSSPHDLDNSLAADSELLGTNKTPVTIYFACPDQNRELFIALAETFQAENPLIEVEIISLDDVRDGATNTGIDHRVMSRVDTAFYWLTSEGAIDGSFRDLTPFIEADSSFAPNDFFPGTLSAFSYRGLQWALPTEARVWFMLYDRNLFDKADINYPTLDWKRDEFLAAAQKTTIRQEDEEEQYGFLDNALTRSAFIPALSIPNDYNQQSPLNATSVIEDVRWYTDLALQYDVMPVIEPTQEGFDLEFELRNSGRVAMWPDLWLSYESQKGTRDIGVTLFPTDSGPQAVAHMYAYVMSSGTQHPRESWQWLSFLTRQSLFGGDWLPARRSVAEVTEYWDQFGADEVELVKTAIEHLIVVSPIKPGVRELHTAVESVLLEGALVEEALAQAQADLEETLASTSNLARSTIDIPGERRSVTVRFAPPPSINTTVYQTLADSFHESQRDLQVEIVEPAQVADADCFGSSSLLDASEVPAYLLNLQPLLEADPDFDLGDFQPELLALLRSQGNLYGIPLQALVRVIFYNSALFDAAGITYPQPDWTLDDFLAIALALTGGSEPDKQYGFMPLNGDASLLRTFLTLQGASEIDVYGHPRLDTPEMEAALRWYADLILTHGVSPLFFNDLPEPRPEFQEARHTLVREGRVAMWSDFIGIERDDVWPQGNAVGVVPLPVGQVKATDFLTEGLFISAGTPHPEACWQWIKFLSEQPILIRTMPARQSMLTAQELVARAPMGATETFQALLEYQNVLAPPHLLQHTNELNQALAEVLDGSDPATALQRAQQAIIKAESDEDEE